MDEPTAIILAGGKSSRMGQDKGLMIFEGTPMISHVIEAVKPLTNRIIIISNDENYNQFGYPVYSDINPNKGPLGGIITGLTKTTSEVNWVLSCDTPYLTSPFLSALLKAMNDETVLLTRFQDKIHPLIGTYRRSALNVLKEQLALDKLKLLTALKAVQTRFFNAEHFEELTFKNINSRTDL